ncbi:winged helix-turn-helix transcriptional regulator [Lentisalinibacter salinarum]|uniref:winged helix-turn-helix transcriptional regulator n=1 Tax=Lentisalinibacter salinarum TaxID=2992239 RepID=UPI0038682B68
MTPNTGDKSRGSARRPIMALLDLLGRRWTLRVLWELRDQRLSFRQLRERCDNVSPTSLNRRLRELREAGLVDLEDEGYGYTQRGRELGERLMGLSEWSQAWYAERN